MMHGYGGSWYNLDQLCSSSMRGWVVAVVKEDLRAKNPGFGRLRQSKRFGFGPDLSAIDTHLQFLCIPHSHSSTPHKCELYSQVHSSLCCFLYIPPILFLIFSLYSVSLSIICLPALIYARLIPT